MSHPNALGQPGAFLRGSAIQPLEVAVEMLMRAKHQSLECALIENPVGRQAEQAVHAEP